MTSPSVSSFMNTFDNEMNVTKRDGQLETVAFDKILKRIKTLGQEVDIKINYTSLVMKVIDQLYDGIPTTKIDELSAEQCASLASTHPDYNVLAGRIVVSNHHKNTSDSFTTVMTQMYEYLDKNDNPSPLVSDELYSLVKTNGDFLDELIDYQRDFLIDYFGFKTLERSYLMKINGKIVERPQHMWLRVAIGIHGDNLYRIKETYDLMSNKYFTHATPTLFNSGTPRPQLSSCFLISMESDSIDGIYNTLKDCALISKLAGGIGLHIHNVRATGSHIRGTNGTSNGIVPMLRVFNNTAKYVDQCVHPETIIYTTQGPKQIQHCTIGETSIFNMNGDSEVIHNVLEHHYEGEVLHIKIEYSLDKLIITPQHPIFVLRNNEKQWIDAGDILMTDQFIYPIPNYEKDIVNITKDDCQIYSYIMKHGTIEDGIYKIHTKTIEIDIDFIINYLDSKLVEYDFSNDYITWKPSLQLPFRHNDFYNESGQKEIHSRWLHLPIEKIEALCCMFHYCDYDMTIERQVKFLLLRLCKQKLPYYGLKYLDNSKDFVCTSIVSISKNNYKGILYDLQMEKQHDYLLENGLVHNGGGKRNGSFAIYLEPWHSDIEMFLQMRKNHGDEDLKARDLFYALWIPDLFMERVKSNGKWTLMCPDECPGLSDVYGEEFKQLYENYESSGKGRITINARDLWFKMLDAQMETGTPYMLYKDAVNQKSNQKNIGIIKSSNLCVAPETLVLTNQGHITIESLQDQTIQVWNGEEYSEVTVRKTGENQEVIDVYTDDGLKLTCTPYHKFYVQTSYYLGSVKQLEARKLQPGDKLIKSKYPIIDGSNTMLYPYTHGFFCGDGTYRNISQHTESPCKFQALQNHYFCKRHLFNETENYIENNEDINHYVGNCKALSYSKLPMIQLYGNKKELVNHLECRIEPIYEENNNRITVTLPGDIDDKYDVPSGNCSIKTKLEWFAGYCDADGTISLNGTNEQLQVASINHDFLIKIKLMLQTCGINPKVKLSTSRETSYLPDGKGGYKDYVTKPVYRLLVSSCDLYQLFQLGFKPYRLIINGVEPQRNAKQFIKIIKVVNENRISDTYCFTEQKRHTGIFNGIITGQCTEITEYSDDKETAVCNLASIGLPSFISGNDFDYTKLHEVTKVVTYNLNKIIDVNYYPTEKTRRSNMRHRPIGIGVQGLADVFVMMNVPFHSEKAKEINKNIFETIYHGALESSCEIAEVEGAYETFQGSPASNGILQFDLWKVDPGDSRYDWISLKHKIFKNGLRNSLLVAPMPTASTSQILGFNECIEPITSNIYSRRTNAGDFIQANKFMMMDLIKLDLWNEKIKNNIIANNGSIQQIEIIPQEIKDKYKTVWEIPMRHLIDMAADRGAFICQSQSLNLWLEDPTYNSLTSMHFYSWSKGLKTGIYYLRRRGRHQAQQFTIEPEKRTNVQEEDEICEMCSS